MLGGPRHRKQWEGRRKWLRGASWNLKKVENVILPSVMRDGDGDMCEGVGLGGTPGFSSKDTGSHMFSP